MKKMAGIVFGVLAYFVAALLFHVLCMRENIWLAR